MSMLVTSAVTCSRPHDDFGVAAQVQRPAVAGVDALADGFPAGAVAIEIAMLERDASAIRCLGDEAHLDLAGAVRVGLDLPSRVDVPADDDPVRRLICEHPRPAALAPVDATVVDVATDSRLEDGLGDVDAEHVVLARLERAEVIGKDGERALDRRLDDDLVADGRRCCWRGHQTSFSACSTATL